MSGGLFTYAGSRLSAASRSLSLFLRKPALIASHDTNAADEVQHLIQAQERGALAALHVLNVASPA